MAALIAFLPTGEYWRHHLQLQVKSSESKATDAFDPAKPGGFVELAEPVSDEVSENSAQRPSLGIRLSIKLRA